VRPAILKTLDGGLLCDVERIAIACVGFGERLNQISDVAFVTGKVSADRVCINCDVQDDPLR